MNKSYVFALGALILIVAGVWYWSTRESDEVVLQTPITQPTTEVPATRVYKDDTVGFSVTLPTALSSTMNDSLYLVDDSYTYTATGSGKSILGVKFIIPRAMTTGTNLNGDSYVSVEHLEKGLSCDAVAFLGAVGVKSQTIREGTLTYSFATSTEAAAGNRYEEYVYALPNSNPCLAVRYFIHYGAIENYDPDTIKAFNRAKLFAEFDSIRKTLIVSQ